MRATAAIAPAFAALLTVPPCGCDLAVTDFAGAKIQLTLGGVGPTAAGSHLELWARVGDLPGARVVRLLAGRASEACNAGAASCVDPRGYSSTLSAYTVAPALSMDDACLIDCEGNLLTTAEAKPGNCPPDGPRSPQGDLGAKAIERQIHRLTDEQPTPLLALVSWDDAAADHPTRAPDAAECARRGASCIPDDTPAQERLARCEAFRGKSPHAYTGNPLQLTAPLHGQIFGPLDFTAITPPVLFGGIRIDTDFSLHDLRELWLTRTAARVADLDPEVVDCKEHPDTCRGAVFLQGDAGASMRGVYRMRLSAPSAASTASGSAAVYTRLDEDPVQF